MNNYKKEEFWGNGDEFGDKNYIGYGFGYTYTNDMGNGDGRGDSAYKRIHEEYLGTLLYDVNILFICI